MPTADELIALLNLQPHPKEGGFFRETYRCAEQHPAASLPARYGAKRAYSTAIYYLLTPTTFSAMHRLASDEVFHFYLGGPVRMLQLSPDGGGRTIVLGSELTAGHLLQAVVPKGTWQGAFLEKGSDFALLGCTVAPGFEYADYETGLRAALIAQYPAFGDSISRLTVS